jgi:hypothetical protein
VERHVSNATAIHETESFEAIDFYIKLLLSIPELLSPVRRYTLSDQTGRPLWKGM